MFQSQVQHYTKERS